MNEQFTIPPKDAKINESSLILTDKDVTYQAAIFDRINSDILLMYMIKLNMINKKLKDSDKIIIPQEIKDLLLGGE